MTEPYSLDDPDYALRWPAELLIAELTAILQLGSTELDAMIELLLTEVFEGPAPLQRWRDGAWSELLGAKGNGRYAVLVELEGAAERGELRLAVERRPRYAERRGSATLRAPIDSATTRRRYARIAGEMAEAGYFDRSVHRWCVDDEKGPQPNLEEYLIEELGPLVWPLEPDTLAQLGDDTFYELIELLHDLAARPRRSWFHSFGGCTHYSQFSIGIGRRIYRWRVNTLLAGSEINLRLADEGEDAGRLVDGVDDDRALLIQSARGASTPVRADSVDHAIALFRSRNAGVDAKRSAIVVLAGLIEERRALLKDKLYSSDEGDLFLIANKFAVRHRTEAQRSDYDPAFLDWFFWWFLATVELTDRLLQRPPAP